MVGDLCENNECRTWLEDRVGQGSLPLSEHKCRHDYGNQEYRMIQKPSCKKKDFIIIVNYCKVKTKKLTPAPVNTKIFLHVCSNRTTPWMELMCRSLSLRGGSLMILIMI